MKRPSAFLSLIQRYSALFTWLSIYIILFLFSSAHQQVNVALIICTMTIVPLLIVWATLYYLLVPKFMHHHQVWFYLWTLLLLGIVSFFATETDLQVSTNLLDRGLVRFPDQVEAAIARGESQRSFIHTKYGFLLLTTAAMTTISWLLDERKRLNRLQREQRSQMELKYLRAQINPHFLFNALNCIYSLTLLQDEKAPDSVMKLSEMLRYVTDDCRSDTVPLQKEVSYIRNYIDFQLIRMERQADITFDVEIQNPSYKIPPMIFQPMVENCFKHSRIVDHPDGHIHISLRQDDRQLVFIADNSKVTLPQPSEETERFGIGIKNVRQRLDLLFGSDASFKVQETETDYKIKLCIKS